MIVAAAFCEWWVENMPYADMLPRGVPYRHDYYSDTRASVLCLGRARYVVPYDTFRGVPAEMLNNESEARWLYVSMAIIAATTLTQRMSRDLRVSSH